MLGPVPSPGGSSVTIHPDACVLLQIQGTCLGFEMLSVIISGNTSLLRR